jgi:uncharacterized membrane protein
VANQSLQNIPGFGGQPNMSLTERGISLAIGFGMMAAAVQPRPNKLLSLLALVGGAGMALRGASGHCPVKAELGHAGNPSQIAHG